MHWVDGLVVGCYLLVTLYIGLRLARRVSSAQDFFLAGRRLPFWAIGMSLVVSDIGALEMVGGTAGAFQYGVAQANYEWIGCVPAMIAAAILFMPVYWRSGVFSVPEYLGRRYGAAVQTIEALLWVAFLAAALGVFFQASAEMFAGVFGWPQWVSVGLTAIVVSVYTVGGGLEAVVATDVIQCATLFVGGLTLAGIGLARVGGLGGLRQRLDGLGGRTRHHLKLLMPVGLKDQQGQPTGYPWTGVLLGLGFVLSPAYWIGNQAIVQRSLGARSEWTARAAMIFGAVLKTFVPLAFVLPGLLGLGLFGEQSNLEPNSVYPRMILELLPIGLRGMLYAAFLAALMSSVDSYTNSAATIIVRDLYGRFWGRDKDDAHFLRLGRRVSLGIIAAGVTMVPAVAAHRTIYDAFQTYLSFFQGPTLALLLFGLLGRWATPAGGLAALLCGVATSIWMHTAGGVHFLHAAWWSFCAATMALVVVSSMTRRLSDQQLETLVFDWTGQERP